MSRALTIFFALLALGVLAYVCIQHHRQEIQDEVAANAAAELSAGGFGFARVVADGQHITLTGTAPSGQARDAAGRAALAGRGVVEVDNQIAVEALVPPPGPDATPMIMPEVVEEPSEPAPVEAIPESLQIVLSREARRVDMDGFALNSTLDERRQTELLEQVRVALPDWQVNSGITATANIPTDLSAPIQRVLPALAIAQSARLDVDTQGVRVDAKLESFAQRTALQARLDAVAGTPVFADRNLSWMLDSPPATVDGCQAAFDDLLRADSILFTTSKAEIRQSSYGLLDKLVGVARDCDVSVTIGGHTDSRGPAEFNDYLSLERARSVRQYLIANGVDPSRVSAKGFGSANPVADNNTINGRQRNRRIEFRVTRTQP